MSQAAPTTADITEIKHAQMYQGMDIDYAEARSIARALIGCDRGML